MAEQSRAGSGWARRAGPNRSIKGVPEGLSVRKAAVAGRLLVLWLCELRRAGERGSAISVREGGPAVRVRGGDWEQERRDRAPRAGDGRGDRPGGAGPRLCQAAAAPEVGAVPSGSRARRGGEGPGPEGGAGAEWGRGEAWAELKGPSPPPRGAAGGVAAPK